MKRVPNIILFVSLALSSGVALSIAQPQQSPKMQAANKLFNAQQWEEAAKAYSDIVKEEPKNTAAWHQLGVSRYSLKQYTDAREAFQKEVAITPNPTAMYNIACIYSLTHDKENALEWLDKAIANNLSPFVVPEADTDLEPLHGESRFKELTTVLDKKRRPCLYTPEARQFDFWIGEWDVFNPQGLKVGTSVIQQVSEGCGILENWKNRFGLTGKSLNFYDPGDGKWYQYWMGMNGVPTRYSGVYRDKAMRYITEPFASNGKTVQMRLTFFNIDENTVRQFAEQTTDGGTTWSVSYDFKYVRTK